MVSVERIWAVAGAAFFVAGGAGCAPETAPVRPAAIEIDGVVGSAMYIGPAGGSTRQYVALVTGANGERVKGASVVWTVSSPEIVTVSAGGLVRAVSVGSSYLTATVEDLPTITDSIPLAVNPVPVASVMVTPRAVDLRVGSPDLQSFQLRIQIQDSVGARLTGRTVTWSSGNPAVVTVSADGVVTAVGPGLAAVEALSEGKIGTSNITVFPPATTRSLQRQQLQAP